MAIVPRKLTDLEGNLCHRDKTYCNRNCSMLIDAECFNIKCHSCGKFLKNHKHIGACLDCGSSHITIDNLYFCAEVAYYAK